MLGSTREKVLYGILSKLRGVQRYTLWRWFFATVATALVAALPLLDILRFDLWAGRHMLLGEQVGLVAAAKAFAFPFLAINVAIALKSRFLGRWLCGFGCPVGALARLGEWARFRDQRGAKNARIKQGRRSSPFWRVLTVASLASALLAAITFSFWVDWRVFLEGSPLAQTLAGAFLLVMAAFFFWIVRALGLRFCRDLCPSGVYFAILGPRTLAGVEFAHPEACTSCGACDIICPMDLSPRHTVDGYLRDPRGIYPEALTNFGLCIRCGDCVVACEGVGQKGGPVPALRMGFLGVAARRDLHHKAAAEEHGLAPPPEAIGSEHRVP